VDGWQQAWSIPSGDGDVHVAFAPDRPYRTGLVLGLLGMIAVLGALLLSPRVQGAQLPALSGRRLPASALVGLALLQAGLLVGTLGVVVVAVTLVVGVLLRRSDEDAVAWGLGGAVLVSAAAYGIRPWGGFDGWAGGLAWPHYLVLVSLAGAVLLALDVPPRTRGRLRRMAGRSSTR
jgi:arabinofuranan 3-O-arabinosyltransferase